MRRPDHGILVTEVLLALGLVGLAYPAVAETAPGIFSVRILVFNDAGVPDDVLSEARKTASTTYKNAGIETVWPFCPDGSGSSGLRSDCGGPFNLLDLVLRIRPSCDGLTTGRGDDFGIALISPDGNSGRQAYVFFDRVQSWSPKENWQSTHGRLAGRLPLDKKTAVVLAVVMAHEVGHLLLGCGSHSRKGVMQPTWTRSDLEEVYWGSQGFTPFQVKQLRARLGDRARP